MRSDTFVVKEWLLPNPDDAFLEICKFMSEVKERHWYYDHFAKEMVFTTIFSTNKLEGTISSSLSQADTHTILRSTLECKFTKKMNALQPLITWKAGGDNEKDAARSQLSSHLRATQFIIADEIIARDLTVEDVLHAHALIMENSIQSDNAPLSSGEFRNVNVHAGEHVYPPGDPAALRRACERIIKQFNEDLRCCDHDGPGFIEVTATLFYDMITLHPFVDGNGRLCRLLVTYALRRAGFPFAIPLSSHHKKSRKHYMLAIFERRNRGISKQLNTLILTSMNYVMRNYLENARLMVP